MTLDDFKQLLGTEDLSSIGLEVKELTELRVATKEKPFFEVAGYFENPDLASAVGRGKGWYGRDATTVKVEVLTNGKVSFKISSYQSSAIVITTAEDVLKKASSTVKEKCELCQKKHRMAEIC